jgi:hypothetical protein
VTRRGSGVASARLCFGLLWAGVVGLAACSGGVPSPYDRTDPDAAELRIFAENRSAYDVRVYVQSTRGLQLLGIVGGNATRSFRVSWTQLDDLRLRIEELAGLTYQTNRLPVSPGDRLDLILPANQNNVFIRRR